MASDQHQSDEPLFHDALFRRKKKNGSWDVVDCPRSFAPIADTHAHLDMLPNPALSLARAGAHNVAFVETIVDPVSDGDTAFTQLSTWIAEGERTLCAMAELTESLKLNSKHDAAGDSIACLEGDLAADSVCDQAICRLPQLPRVRIGLGVHPHNAKDYTDALEADMIARIQSDPRVSALGEVGLDYHYDSSPRDVQREVFRRQIRLAHQLHVPLLLHMREAHDDGFTILCEEGFPSSGVLLHCYNLDAVELRRWVEADCYIAFGGPLTFKKSDYVRDAAKLVPLNRLVTETDAPFMTPEPLRGQTCGSEHVVWTAEVLASVFGFDGDSAERRAFYEQMFDNAVGLLDRTREVV